MGNARSCGDGRTGRRRPAVRGTGPRDRAPRPVRSSVGNPLRFTILPTHRVEGRDSLRSFSDNKFLHAPRESYVVAAGEAFSQREMETSVNPMDPFLAEARLSRRMKGGSIPPHLRSGQSSGLVQHRRHGLGWSGFNVAGGTRPGVIFHSSWTLPTAASFATTSSSAATTAEGKA